MRRVRYRQHPEKDVVGRELVHRPRTLHRADTDAWAATELAGHAEVEIDDGKEKNRTLGAGRSQDDL